jgi:hypothetical protein
LLIPAGFQTNVLFSQQARSVNTGRSVIRQEVMVWLNFHDHHSL